MDQQPDCRYDDDGKGWGKKEVEVEMRFEMFCEKEYSSGEEGRGPGDSFEKEFR